MTNKRQKATKVKWKWGRKHNESTTKQLICLEYNYSSLEKEFSLVEFCWSSFACSRTQNFTIVDEEKDKIKQIYIWNTMTTGYIM